MDEPILVFLARREGFAPLAALLTQSCSLRSVTFTPTYRRSLISSLQGVLNALLNGQLVPLRRYQRRPLPSCKPLSNLRKAKRFAPAKRLPPSNPSLFSESKKYGKALSFPYFWRGERDSNPRKLSFQQFSRLP